jgi:hypothetical protein
MSKRWSRILLLAAAALLVSLTAWAQSSTTGVIEGRVRDQAGNAIADATVSAVANRAPASTVADGQGRYNLANLPPGEYTIRAEAPGKSAVVLDGVVVSINTRTRVDLTLVTGQAETVTVTAEAPTVDTKSVTTGGNFKVANFIDQIPVGRNLAATLTLAPGVEGGGGTGAGNYSISGSSGLENSYIVDGVNITSTGYGGIGTFNNVYGSLGTGVTYDFLEEVQVKTGGIDVEFGQATGGVVNTVVKSGTNDLSGSVALYAGAPINEYKQVDFFIGAVNSQKGSWGDNADYDLGLSVGGPIVKDKLFYFVAYNPVMGKDSAAIQDIALPSNISNGVVSSQPFDPTPQYPAAAAGLQTRERRSDNYAAKLTWYANPNHRLELSAFGDPSSGDLGVQRFSLRNIDFPQGGGLSDISYGANNFNLKYDAVFTPTLFMQAMIGRHDGKFEETSALNKSRYTDDRQLRCFLSPKFCADFNGNGVYDPAVDQPRDNAARWANGGVGFISNSTDLNDQFKAVVTWVAGNNELKGGVSYDRIEYSDHQDYSGTDIPVKFGVDTDVVPNGVQSAEALSAPCVAGPNPTDCFVLLDTRGGVVANLRQSATGVLGWRTTRGRYNPNPGPTKTNDVAIFLQDTFTFAQNWTLKAGVRASQQEIKGEGNYTLQFYFWDGNPIPVTKTPTNLRIEASPAAGEYKFDWAFAPRIGMTWDTKGDGRSKVYANLARYYERVPNDLAIRALSNEAGFGTVTYNNWDLDGETGGIPGAPDWTSARNLGSFRGGQTRVEDGTKLPYVDEFVLGWQQEVGRDTSVELRGIYREQGRALEDVQFNSVEATENYYAYAYFGREDAGNIDTVPFPNDPATFLPDPNDPSDVLPGSPFGEYVLANPGENTSAGFPKAVRKYYALEAILNKRFGDHWLFYGNMRFARLQGNYEGLFRNDNGQSDPNITSLFDFPNSPLLAGQFDAGPLNTDRPFSMKLYGSYQWDNGINLGAALNVAAGTPRTPLLAHPNGFYQNAGEVPGASPIYYWYSTFQPGSNGSAPCAAAALCLTTGTADDFFRDAGADTAPGSWAFPHLYDYAKVGRGANGRTNTEYQIDLSLGWSHQFNRWATLSFGATVFNVLNSRETTTFNDNIELQAGVTDPDYLKQSGFQNPRNLRAYAKWSF